MNSPSIFAFAIMNIITLSENAIENRKQQLHEILLANESLKMFDKDTYNILIDIILLFSNFCNMCNGTNSLIAQIIAYKDNKDKQLGFVDSSRIYMERLNEIISNMIYLVKKLMMRAKPKYFGSNADILFDYNVTFSYDNLRDAESDVIIVDSTPNITLMKALYKSYMEYFESFDAPDD